MYIIGLIFYYLISNCYSFIIPNELVSALGLIFSNIPRTKVGIDSRFGLGFRLGPHADYQTLIEIGPQINTNSISTNGTIAKRQSINVNRLQRLYNEAIRNFRREMSNQRKNLKIGKNSQKTSEKIEFQKVAGIDDFREVKKKNSKNSVTESDSPTKFTLI